MKTGIVPIKEDGMPDSSKYNYGETTQNAFALTASWTSYTNIVEVESAGLYSVFLVNSKSGTDKNILLDEVTLMKKNE